MTEAASLPAIYSAESCRPILKWAGGKKQLLPELVSRMPRQYNRYFEPFIGGGALYFALTPQRSFISDINPELINVYSVVRDRCEDLIQVLKKHRYEKKYYYDLREADRSPSFKRWGEVRRAARFIYLNKTCFNGLYRVNSKGYFNVPFGRYKNPGIFTAEHLKECSQVLKRSDISCRTFQSALSKVKKGDFVYLDPPYVPLSISSSFTSYSKDGFDFAMQEQLRDYCIAIDKRGAKFMLSNSSAPIVYELYSMFDLEEVSATRTINSVGKKRGKVNEVLVRNYTS